MDQRITNDTAAYTPAWTSLRQYSVPEWFADAKFGIFIHWGAYSVPAFENEWYPRNMYEKNSPSYEHHRTMWGPQSEFGYKDFIPKFKAEKWNPEEWASLFRRAGARYIVPVAEHHDGFAMYDSALTEWNSTRMGPGRDIVGELGDAVREQGMVYGLSSHRAEHWWFFNPGKEIESDVQDPRFDNLYGPARSKEEQPDEEYLEDWLARTQELVDKYKPQVLWFDWWIEEPSFEPYLQRIASHYYNRGLEWGKGVVVNYKHEAYPEGTAVYDIERGQFADKLLYIWQTDTSVSKNSWGYVQDQQYKDASSIVGDLVDIVSKNGNLLLNIGPRPDGTIPEQEREILLDIGSWLDVNGEAIYGSRPWKVYGEGPTQVVEGSFNDIKRSGFTERDFRFTMRGNVLYAICLGWPEGEATIGTLSSESGIDVSDISMLGSSERLSWSQNESGLRVSMPSQRPCDYVCTFKITWKSET